MTLTTIVAITACAADTDIETATTGEYTLEEMLVLAIEDEYHARAEYEALIEEFGVDRPFSNIIKAEITHAGTLLEAYEIGVEAEIANIALYENLIKGSENHKAAFERGVEGGERRGRR